MARKRKSWDYYLWCLERTPTGHDPDFELLAVQAKREGYVGRKRPTWEIAVTFRLAWHRRHRMRQIPQPMSIDDFLANQNHRLKTELCWLRTEKHILETLLSQCHSI